MLRRRTPLAPSALKTSRNSLIHLRQRPLRFISILANFVHENHPSALFFFNNSILCIITFIITRSAFFSFFLIDSGSRSNSRSRSRSRSRNRSRSRSNSRRSRSPSRTKYNIANKFLHVRTLNFTIYLGIVRAVARHPANRVVLGRHRVILGAPDPRLDPSEFGSIRNERSVNSCLYFN